MANSKWFLWIGLFLCCTGIGTIGGLIMVAIYFYNDYTGKQPKYNKEEYANSSLKEHVWQKYHFLGIRGKVALTVKDTVSVEFVDTTLKESVMIVHVV